MSKEEYSAVATQVNGNIEAKSEYEAFVKNSLESGRRMIVGVMPCCGNEMLFLTPQLCEPSFEFSMFCVHCNANVFNKVSFHNAHITKIFAR